MRLKEYFILYSISNFNFSFSFNFNFSFKVIFVSIVPFNPHSNHVEWSGLSGPFFRGECWMSKQVSGLPMSANPSSGSAEAKTQFSCIQVKHSSWVRYTFQNLAKKLLKNRYFSRRNNDPTLIAINFKIFKNKAVQVYWEV